MVTFIYDRLTLQNCLSENLHIYLNLTLKTSE